MFALVLASVAMAACNGDPFFAQSRLFGMWTGEQQTFNLPLPADGVRPVLAHMDVTFTPDRRFHRELVVVDPQLGDYVEFAQEGTFSTDDGMLRLTADRGYVRAGGEATPHPTLQPLADRATVEYGYALRDDVLTVNWCPANALCVEPGLTHFTRVVLGPLVN